MHMCILDLVATDVCVCICISTTCMHTNFATHNPIIINLNFLAIMQGQRQYSNMHTFETVILNTTMHMYVRTLYISSAKC